MKLAICASASFYTKVIEFSYELEKIGFEVLLPATAARMKAEGRENEEVSKKWDNSLEGYHGKALLIRGHFKEIKKADAILVLNYEKHGKKNYIGPNVLMEMSVAFFLSKPIYVLNGMPQDSPLIDEILGLEPIFIEGNLGRIKP